MFSRISTFALCLLATVTLAKAQNDPAAEATVIAVGRTMPAVVNINTERIVRRAVRDPYDDFFNQFFGGGAMRRPRILSQKVQSLGSGFIVDPAGYIVTNEHVVQRAAELKISVTTNDGKTYEAKYIAGAPQSDLAFLKIESKQPLPFISPTDLSPNLLGETVLVLGNPLGYGSSVARGILSAKNRTVSVEEVEYKNLIQTDAAINPGNSGGPVVDISGKLVGISSVKMAFTPQGVPTQGLGFAIPGETVREKVAEFKKIASDPKAAAAAKPKVAATLAQKFFGLQLQDLTEQLAESFGEQAGSGVLISDVDPKSPANEAGMKRGLVIYKVGRYQVTSAKQVEDLLATVDSGAPVDFTVGIVRRIGGQNVRQLQPVQLIAQ